MEYLTRENKINLSEDVQTQLINLGLTPEIIQGDILDIGAGEGTLARAFKDKTGTRIISIDTFITEKNKNFVQKGDARRLAYPDNSFDLVISHASIPHIFLELYSEEFREHSIQEIESAVKKSLSEIVRVLKAGKSSHLGPINLAENYEPQRVIKKAVMDSIEYIRSLGIKVAFEFIKTIINPENGEESESYRLILQKPD